MALPEHLLRTYRRYKAEEEDVLQWIAEEARKRNIRISSKLKGRARTIARREGLSKLAIFDVLPPVAALAASPQPPSMPMRIAEKLATVLELRKKCVAWYRSNTPRDDQLTRDANARHQHCVIVLQEAALLLQTEAKVTLKTRNQDHKTQKSSQDVKNVFNRFHALNIDHTDSAIENERPDSSTTASNITLPPDDTPMNNQLRKEERIHAEFSFAMFCLHEDIQQIEEFLFLEFVRYRLDQANSFELPFLIQMAIDMVMKAESGIYATCEDADACKVAYAHTINAAREDQPHNSPLFRMRKIVAGLVAQMESVPPNDNPPYVDDVQIVCPPRYLSMSTKEQFAAEQEYLLNLLVSMRPKDDLSTPFPRDLLTLAIYWLRIRDPDLAPFRQMPVAIAFAVRLHFLLSLVGNNQASLAFNRASNVFSEFEALYNQREDYYRTTKHQSASILVSYSVSKAFREDRQNRLRKCLQATKQPLRNALRGNPVLWCLSDVLVRFNYAYESVRIIEKGVVVRMLAHFANLLREEALSLPLWPDLDFLTTTLGSKFIYQDDRPALSDNHREAFVRRISYALGLHGRRTVMTMARTLRKDNNAVTTGAHLARRLTPSSTPLLHMLSGRLSQDMLGITDYHFGIEETELVATATLVQRLHTGKIHPVNLVFDKSSNQFKINNRADLCKLCDRSPTLQPAELLAVVKKGSQDEFAFLRFDYLKFERSCSDLVELLFDELWDLKLPIFGLLEDADLKTTYDKMLALIMDVLWCFDGEHQRIEICGTYKTKIDKARNVFGKWLVENGNIGLRDQGKHEYGHLSSLDGDILKVVEDIVARRGLLDDVFATEQLRGMESVKVTASLESVIRDAWVKHKKERRA